MWSNTLQLALDVKLEDMLSMRPQVHAMGCFCQPLIKEGSAEDDQVLCGTPQPIWFVQRIVF